MAVPYTFGTATAAIPLSQLDSNFNTAITIGNTAVQLGNTITALANVSLVNATVTSLASPITAAQGGTGLATLTANNVVLGNGTNNVQLVAPGTTGNVLVSNGTTWISNAAATTAQVYPGAGIANSTGTAWGTSYTTNGSGTVVALTTSPNFTTPALGTPSSGNLTSCTADGTNGVGYKNIPQVGSAKTSSYTLAAADVGKFVVLGTSGTIVIPASTFAVGDAISIMNNTSGTIACTCSAITTVYKGGTDTNISSTGFSITTRGVVTILFVTTTTVVITGNLA
jgi:hypothetical protein